MRKTLFVLSPVFIAGFLLVKNNAPSAGSEFSQTRAEDIISCGMAPDDEIYTDASGKFIRLLPGRGEHSYAISTNNDSAQLYFDQGLSMYYSYHMREALASFREVARFDSNCVMAYWGQALALGPTFNFGYQYKMNAKVPGVLE